MRNQKKEEDSNESFDDLVYNFKYKEGRLEVSSYCSAWDEPREEEQGITPSEPTIDPYANTKGPRAHRPSLKNTFGDEQILKAASKGMRVGTFIQVEGSIKETNAKFREGSLITLLNFDVEKIAKKDGCLLYTSPSPRDATLSRMPSSA